MSYIISGVPAQYHGSDIAKSRLGNQSVTLPAESWTDYCWSGHCWNTWILYHFCTCQWIGLRENLQETMVFTMKYRGVL